VPLPSPDVVAELAGWWTRLEPRTGRTAVLAIDGRSGAGKTDLATAVTALVPGAATVALEEIYPGWDGLAAGVDLLVTRVLAPLAAGRAAAVPQWDWAAGRPAPARPLPPDPPLLLVEGVGAGARACAPYLSALVWVEAPAQLRRERALARDGALYAPHWERWARQEEVYLGADRPQDRADVVVAPASGEPPWVVTGGRAAGRRFEPDAANRGERAARPAVASRP
jgi:para-aminobenzoate synthetase